MSSPRQPAHRPVRSRRSFRSVTTAVAVLAGLVTSGCSTTGSATTQKPGVINAVGAENQYANVLAQIGGRYVSVSSILDNPNTDPHTFESSPGVAEEVGAAQLVVQNGLGYDDFMNKIESASPSAGRKVIVAQQVLGLPDSTPNPHLWYDPATMPAVAKRMAGDLGSLQPDHRAYFQQRLAAFDASLRPWLSAISTFKAHHPDTPVAVTEPVADYLLRAMGVNIVTPFVFQADVMNGVDPSPQGITQEEGFMTNHNAKVFCYNEQVVDSLTTSIRQKARSSGIPVVAVYETMPASGYDYQSWMMAEVGAIESAAVHGKSTEHL